MSFDGDLYPEAGAAKVITSKGDLVRGNASGDRERYGIGSTGQVLTVASGTVAWQSASGGSATTAQVILSSGGHRTTTSTSLTDVSGMSITLPNTGGTLDCLVNESMSVTIDVGDSLAFALVKNTTALVYTTEDPPVATQYTAAAFGCLCDGDGDTMKLQWKTAGGNTGTIRVTATWATPCLSAFAV